MPANPAIAGESAHFNAAVPIADAQPLTDEELGAIRGAGFLDGLISALVGAVSASTAGILAGVTSAGGLPGGLPSLNLVQAQINDQPTITLAGVDPQELSLSGPGYSIELSAGVVNGPQALASVHFSSLTGAQTIVTAASR